MHLVAVEEDLLVHIAHRSIHSHAHIAGPSHVLEHGLMMSLAILDQGGQDHDTGSLGQAQHCLRDLRRRLLADLASALRAVGHADAGIEQTQVVIGLGHRAHSRAGIVAHPLLVNGDGWRESLDLINVWLLHLSQKLAGVGGQ